MGWSVRGLPGWWARRVRRQLAQTRLSHLGIESTTINRPHAGGVIDGIEVGGDGMLAVIGWAPEIAAYAEPMRLRVGDTSISPSSVFRVARPDLAQLGGDRPQQLGLVVEFMLPPSWSGLAADLTVAGAAVASLRLPAFSQPAYCEFYGDPGVWHRDDVYGIGPPVSVVSSEILDLSADLRGPVLDFGCGAGSLVAALRERGIDAQGLELDTAPMRGAGRTDLRGHITYYSGSLPAPFEDGAFESVTCCEVLEHIPDYEAALAELARLARGRVLITVPDMSGVPRGYHHGVVPWHLLERSHVNFFSQQSLGRVLQPHFRDVQFFRIGEVRCGRMRFYTSLAALCAR